MNGSSTGFIPNHVRRRKIIKNLQNLNVFVIVFNWYFLF
jgi:hypothetical protein